MPQGGSMIVFPCFWLVSSSKKVNQGRVRVITVEYGKKSMKINENQRNRVSRTHHWPTCHPPQGSMTSETISTDIP